MSIKVSCPGCGGPITFAIGSSLVAVCPYCRSAVARGDRRLEDLGKVAALVDTDSPLELGLRGRYQGVPFELVGRSQLSHQAGGVWDEWYAAFKDGRWGWLAEAQGRFYMTFDKELAEAEAIPAFDELPLGGPVSGLPAETGKLIVAEKGLATTRGAEGEIPWRFEPNISYAYADVAGPKKVFGTLDYSFTPPRVYLGYETTLTDLGIPKKAKKRAESREVAGVQINCPNCGGALALRAPDQTKRVGCPNCGALLSVEEGQLRFLQALGKEFEPLIPLGSIGHFEEHDLTVIGFFRRSVKIEGTRYFWEEYLLYHPQVGFRWLVHSDWHWSYVRPVPPGDVEDHATTAIYEGQTYKIFQKAKARVDYVLGECYWKLEIGEKVEARDYVAPPLMLSRESDLEKEINWSLGTYLPREEVAATFKLENLQRPTTIAPHQPYPHKRIYWYWLIMLAAAMVLFILFSAVVPSKKVLEKTIAVLAQKPGDPPQTWSSEPFDLHARKRLEIETHCTLSNSAIDVEGDLVSLGTSERIQQEFDLAVGYWSGVEDGEAWREGHTHDTTYLSAQPAGPYSLELKIVRDQKNTSEAGQLTVRIYEGGVRLAHWVWALIALSFFPLGMLLYHWRFESKRWEDKYIQGEILGKEDETEADGDHTA